ncbi:MAG: T9SS type A sorting domain-containing protein [Bacteroidota bacterium]
MKRVQLIVGLLLLIGCGSIIAQTSNGTGGGNWSASATWTGGVVPTGSGTITIKSGDSIYIDVAVTITGTLRSYSGKIGVFDSSKVVFGNGGVYEHDVDAGMLPKATWNTGSTCLIDSIVTKSPTNGNQNFYNLTWNCPRQSAGLNLGMNGNTIGGSVRVISSNYTAASKYAFRLTAPSSSVARKPITIKGNVIIDDTTGMLTANGSSTVDTLAVYLGGNIISHGIFQLANGSAATCNWFVAGNIQALGGSFTTNSDSTKPDSMIFNGTTKQSFVKAGSVGSMSNIYFDVRGGAILDMDTSSFGASAFTRFTLEAGGTLITGSTKGFEGNLNNGGAKILSSGANYVFDGDSAQVTGMLMPTTVNNLTINNAKGVALSQTITINGVLTLTAGQLDNTIPFILGPNATISYGGGSLKIPVTSVPEDRTSLPLRFFVDQNYPNPFNPSTKISYGIPRASFVTVKVFNLLGQDVKTLFSGYESAGIYTLSFDASKLSSGIYFYKIQAGSSVEIKRMMLVK